MKAKMKLKCIWVLYFHIGWPYMIMNPVLLKSNAAMISHTRHFFGGGQLGQYVTPMKSVDWMLPTDKYTPFSVGHSLP